MPPLVAPKGRLGESRANERRLGVRNELKVIADFYDFMLYLIQRVEKFPRHHRYSLGIAIENRLQDLLAMLLRAQFTRDRHGILKECNIQLDVLRYQLRLAGDLKTLPLKSQGHAIQRMKELGAQIGGWARRGPET